jgi:lipoyl(octanoyl) transferase
MAEARCRLLPFAVADGPRNMAADEVLLESATAGIASLRFYGWSEATVSLGYFQPEKVRRTEPLLRLPFVRRPSGGAMLVHHREVTYCLALPPGQPWQTGASWLCTMHTIIAGALASLGVSAKSQAAGSEPPFSGTLCFQHLTAGDLLIGAAKVVGSAQRRQRGALMQHGSILLARSMHTPMLPGIEELAGRRITSADACAAIRAEFARRTSWQLVHDAWTPAELSRADELATTKYRHERWNQKR